MKSFEWKVIHHTEKKNDQHSKVTPIYQTSAFSFNDLDDLESFFSPENQGYMYSRYGNPNSDELAAMVANLEEAPVGVTTSSGMSAILAGILSVVKAGDSVVIPEDVYGGTYDLFQKFFQEWQVNIETVSFENLHALEKKITEKTALIYTESVTNPLLRVEKISEVARIAKRNNLTLMVDNTFATPYFIQPYQLGADLVVHSATKYIGGHSDVTAGVLTGNEKLIEAAKQKAVQLGMNLSPFESWLTVRGLKTLVIRMKQQSETAMRVANFLHGQSGIRVYYPEGLAEHGNGAMVSFEMDERYDVESFFKALNWIKIVPTLAGVETTVSYPLKTSHRNLPQDLQKKLGISKGLVRLSVGLESENDITEELQTALKKAFLK